MASPPQAENSTYMSPSTAPPKKAVVGASGDPVKPTLLAFHGSGSNATVHTVQLARLMRAIKPYFDIVSLEAPFPSPAGPGILPFFDGCGPFKRWLPPSEKVTLDSMRRGESTNAMAPEVEAVVRSAVRNVRAEGGTVVGLIGFSQGTKVVAGLLKARELRDVLEARKEADDDRTNTSKDKDPAQLDWLDFSFALSVCGSYPPPLLPPCITSALSSSGLSADAQAALLKAKIRTPTFHVQGAQDEWKWAGKGLIEGFYDVDSGSGASNGSQLVEWDMGHHYPVPVEDSERIRDWMVGQLESIRGETWVER